VFYFKGCPRCKGDVYVEKDSYGTYRKCLQCGRMQDLDLRRPGANRRKGSKLVASLYPEPVLGPKKARRHKLKAVLGPRVISLSRRRTQRIGAPPPLALWPESIPASAAGYSRWRLGVRIPS